MIEVFTTDIQDRNQATKVINLLQQNFPELRINFDFDDWEAPVFPCSHKILRVEGPIIDPNSIILTVKKSGFKCDVLPDKVCI